MFRREMTEVESVYVAETVTPRITEFDLSPGATRAFDDVAAVIDSIAPDKIASLRSQRDSWEARLRNALTLPRELREEESCTFRPERFRELRVPTLLLLDGNSPRREAENANGVAEVLPDAQVVTFQRQEHAAMCAAPAAFIREVVTFLDD